MSDILTLTALMEDSASAATLYQMNKMLSGL